MTDRPIETLPTKMPSLRVVPMPSDANIHGDVFGGWIMAQVDIAGSLPAVKRANGRVATVAVNSFVFRNPVLVGDLLSFYAEVVKVGTTSVTVHVEVFAERNRLNAEVVKVTEATLTYVATDNQRKPRPAARWWTERWRASAPGSARSRRRAVASPTVPRIGSCSKTRSRSRRRTRRRMCSCRSTSTVRCAAADAADRRASRSPLDGLVVTVKDLFDVEGELTRAGSRARDGVAAATGRRAFDRAPAFCRRGALRSYQHERVRVLRRGDQSALRYAAQSRAMPEVARIPGGSSSGAAVSVALGIAVAALGSDTGGSIRIPAALCGIVGFKPTHSRVPLAGAFPLSRTLDTVCAMTSCVADAIAVDAVMADCPLHIDAPAAIGELRLAIPQTVVLDALEPAIARAFDRALQRLANAGATLVEIALDEFAERDRMKVVGGFSAPESWAVHRALLARARDQVDPRVVARIERGRDVSAADYLDLIDARADWIARVEARLAGFDAMVCPTVPMVAPALQPLIDDDDAFFATNALLLRNPSLINLLDGCAFSLPCHAQGEMPVGLMLAAPRGADARLASVALAVEDVLR